MEALDPLFYCINLFRRRKFEKCIEVCDTALDANPYDQVVFESVVEKIVENCEQTLTLIHFQKDLLEKNLRQNM